MADSISLKGLHKGFSFSSERLKGGKGPSAGENPFGYCVENRRRERDQVGCHQEIQMSDASGSGRVAAAEVMRNSETPVYLMGRPMEFSGRLDVGCE